MGKLLSIGTKVVPHSKSVWGNLAGSSQWKEAVDKSQPFLYVVGRREQYDERGDKCYALGYEKGFGGDFFLESDFVLYEEPKKTVAPVKQKSVHQMTLEHLDLKPGDKVKVLRKAQARELGWDNSWEEGDMCKAIGKVFVVEDHNPGAIGVLLKSERVCSMNYRFPAYVLELIERAPKSKTMKLIADYEAEVSATDIKVGCQTITKEKFTDLVKLAKEMGLIS